MAWRSRSSASCWVGRWPGLRVLGRAAAEQAREDQPLDAGRLVPGREPEVRLELEQEHGCLAGAPVVRLFEQRVHTSSSEAVAAGALGHGRDPRELMFGTMLRSRAATVKQTGGP